MPCSHPQKGPKNRKKEKFHAVPSSWVLPSVAANALHTSVIQLRSGRAKNAERATGQETK